MKKCDKTLNKNFTFPAKLAKKYPKFSEIVGMMQKEGVVFNPPDPKNSCQKLMNHLLRGTPEDWRFVKAQLKETNIKRERFYRACKTQIDAFKKTSASQ